MNRRVFLNTLLGASVSGVAVASALAYGEDTHDVEVTTVPVRLGLQRPLRAVVLGDIHFDPLYEEDYLSRSIATVNGLQPDLLIYLGDFVTRRLERVKDLATILAAAHGSVATYAVPGNHEGWTDRVFVQRMLDQHAGIRMLCNEVVSLPGEDGVYLTGLDTFSAGNPRPGIIDRTPGDARHIVLAHEPDSFAQLTDSRIKLQISGHTHGGQVRLPLFGALVLPSWGHKFQQGAFTRGERTLYVNRGIGTYLLNMRINCRPEITVFELT